jgi:hypothetical protein
LRGRTGRHYRRRSDRGDELRSWPMMDGLKTRARSGPSDLGRNHDKYLSYPDREEASGAASA